MLLNFLKVEKSESEKQQITDMLIDSSDNLMETLNNLNEVIDINTRRGLKWKSIGLKTKIKNVVQSQSADVSTNNALIKNKVPANIRIKVIPEYIDSIISNFLTNSIKYKSPERDPIIEFSASKEDNYTVLSITDNGLGIDLKKYGDKLFGMYKTFHNNEGARGIGLFITKNQIEAMNGKVKVTSEVGLGTTFKIYFNEKD
jgi:signal transduction histidine kinase